MLCAAVALGTAAGCSICDMVMQQQEVQKQLQQHSKQQQQQQQEQDGPSEQQVAGQLGVTGVIQVEVTHAGQIRDAFQQSESRWPLLVVGGFGAGYHALEARYRAAAAIKALLQAELVA